MVVGRYVHHEFIWLIVVAIVGLEQGTSRECAVLPFRVAEGTWPTCGAEVPIFDTAEPVPKVGVVDEG